MQVLTNYQVARGIVQCYPLVPDCLALCTWVAAEAGEHDALQAVTCGNVPNFPLPGGSTHTTPSASPAPGMQPRTAYCGVYSTVVLSLAKWLI